MTGYLSLDSTRITYRDYWRWKPGPAFLFLAFLKLLRIRFPSHQLLADPPELEVVDPDSQPARLRAALEEPIRLCESRHRSLAFFAIAPDLGPIAHLAAVLVDDSDLSITVARAAFHPRSGKGQTELSVISRLRTGRFLITRTSRTPFPLPPQTEVLHWPGPSLAELLDAHDRRIRHRMEGVVPCGDPRALLLELLETGFQAARASGVLVPASPSRIARMRAATERLRPGP